MNKCLDQLLDNDYLSRPQKKLIKGLVNCRVQEVSGSNFLFVRKRDLSGHGVFINLTELNESRLDAYKRVIYYLIMDNLILETGSEMINEIKQFLRIVRAEDSGSNHGTFIKLDKKLHKIPMYSKIPAQNLYKVMELLCQRG